MSSDSPGWSSLWEKVELHKRIHPEYFVEAIVELVYLDQIPSKYAQ